MCQLLGTPKFADIPGFEHFEYMDQYPQFEHDQFNEFGEEANMDADDINFLKKMLNFDPNQRFTVAELLRDPYLKQRDH